MALAGTTIFDVRTSGSDTLNGGAFDPGQTAGMLTDGAATVATGNSPVFTSASYNFVAGDVGALVYIASGTNWTPGWYQITSVAANAATLSAAIGAAYLAATFPGVTVPYSQNTAAGCATTASPTGATWTIDYSQQNEAQIAYTDLASVGAGLLVSSVAFPFRKQQVGNSIVITGGTNFTAGRYVIASIGALNVATVVGPGNITTGAGVNGTGGQGGSLASPGLVGAHRVASNTTFIQSGTYTLSSASANVSGGTVSMANAGWWFGWNTNRSTGSVDTTRPVISVPNTSTYNGIAVFASAAGSVGATRINVTFQGSTPTTTIGFNLVASTQSLKYCKVSGATSYGIRIDGLASSHAYFCEATGCSGNAGIKVGDNGNANSGLAFGCESYANTCDGFQLSGGVVVNCLSYGNTGGSSRGFWAIVSAGTMIGCTAYGNGSHGFGNNSLAAGIRCINCIAEANTGNGFFGGANSLFSSLYNCATYNNSAATDGLSRFGQVVNLILNTTGTFFTNAAGNDFSLNSTTNQGALARAAGFPGVFPRGTTTGYLDIGAVQHADSGSPGVFSPFPGG